MLLCYYSGVKRSFLSTCGWQRRLLTAGNKGTNGVVLPGFLELYFSLLNSIQSCRK